MLSASFVHDSFIIVLQCLKKADNTTAPLPPPLSQRIVEAAEEAHHEHEENPDLQVREEPNIRRNIIKQISTGVRLAMEE